MFAAPVFRRALIPTRFTTAVVRARPCLSARIAIRPYSTTEPEEVQSVIRDETQSSEDEKQPFATLNTTSKRAGRQVGTSRNAGPTKTIYVGNIPFGIDEEELKEKFSIFGTVLGLRLGLAPNGRSAGYAHIDFESQASATELYNTHAESPLKLDRRDLKIDYAHAVQPRRASSNGQESKPSRKLYVPRWNGSEEELRNAFPEESRNLILSAHARERDGQLTGEIFVEFRSVEKARQALEGIKASEGPLRNRIKYAIDKNGIDRFRDRGASDESPCM